MKTWQRERPRVLFIDHAAVLGGAELYLFDVARAFAPSARVLLFNHGPFQCELERAKIPVTVIQAPPEVLDVSRHAGVGATLRAVPAIMPLVWKVTRLARRYDVVFTNSQKALIVGAVASKLAGKPLIWNLHDILTADHFSALNTRVAVAFANRFSARVLTNSAATQKAFAEAGGDLARTCVVYNGIDTAPFTSVLPEAVSALRRDLKLGTAHVVGVFSRLARWKGQHVLLQALKHLPQVHALLVGDALFSEDQAYAEELRNLACEGDLQDRVHFLGFRHDIPQLLRVVDVVAHTSIAPEPFGRVIAEGMLAHKPVVATRAGGALEIIEHGTTGLLVTPGDPVALAQALTMLLEQPERADVLARAGYEAAAARFSLKTMIESIEREVRAVVQ